MGDRLNQPPQTITARTKTATRPSVRSIRYNKGDTAMVDEEDEEEKVDKKKY